MRKVLCVVIGMAFMPIQAEAEAEAEAETESDIEYCQYYEKTARHLVANSRMWQMSADEVMKTIPENARDYYRFSEEALQKAARYAALYTAFCKD